jgi:hypothetical protein
METQIQLSLPEDFSTLCTIYQIKPELLIQQFIDQVSFPGFYSNPNGRSKWATYFFLNFLDREESKYEVDRELESHYLSIFNSTLLKLVKMGGDNAIPEEAGRKVMRQWLKAVLADRTRYITDNL